jgi:transposase
MGQRYGVEFKREAVRLALTSGLTRKQISADLGMGFSTLNKWVEQSRHDDLASRPMRIRQGDFPASQREPNIARGEGDPKKSGCEFKWSTQR